MIFDMNNYTIWTLLITPIWSFVFISIKQWYLYGIVFLLSLLPLLVVLLLYLFIYYYHYFYYGDCHYYYYYHSPKIPWG